MGVTITGSPADLYATLGVATSATTDEIAAAFRARAKEMHPDRSLGDQETEERFKALTHAYSVLIRPERRAAYDRRRTAPLVATNVAPGRTHEPLFRTPQRARAALWSGVGLVMLGILGAVALASISTGDSAEAITLWLVVVKLVVSGAILWAVGWWRRQRLLGTGHNP